MITESKIRLDRISSLGLHRLDNGDLDTLAANINMNGILTRPTVTTEYRVLGGERVLKALRQLGDTYVRVDVVDTLEDAYALLYRDRESSEPCFKPMSVSEKMILAGELNRLDLQTAETRRVEASIRGRKAPGSTPRRTHPAAMIGRIFGWSEATYSRIRTVWRSAEGDQREPPEIREVAKEQVSLLDRGLTTAVQAHDAVVAARKRAGLIVSRGRIIDPATGQPVKPGDSFELVPPPPPVVVDEAQRRSVEREFMNPRTRRMHERVTGERLARISDQMIGVQLGIKTVTDGEIPIELISMEKTEVAQLTRNLRNAKTAINSLLRQLQSVKQQSTTEDIS